MPFQCWPTVFDAWPTLKQHWVNASRLLGTLCVVRRGWVLCSTASQSVSLNACTGSSVVSLWGGGRLRHQPKGSNKDGAPQQQWHDAGPTTYTSAQYTFPHRDQPKSVQARVACTMCTRYKYRNSGVQ